MTELIITATCQHSW